MSITCSSAEEQIGWLVPRGCRIMAQQLAGETGSQSYGEDGRAFGVEVDGIRLVIVGGQHGRVQWNKRFYTGASRSKGHFVDRILGSGSGRNEDDEFRAVGFAHTTRSEERRVGKECRCGW